MLQKEIIRTVLIIAVAELVAFGMAILDHTSGDYYLATAAFYPVWFLGIYYCCAPWPKFIKLFLAFTAAGLYVEKDRDPYHVISTLAGAILVALIITLGWMWGLVKYVIRIVRAIREQGETEHDKGNTRW